MLFLRGLRDDQCWTLPPLQASLIFDDPNLHWSTYGFIDFSHLVTHAATHNYHVSFAMIPLDTWFAHQPTVGLFKTNTERLSLLIHGNDHISEELARPSSLRQSQQLFGQALQRITRFEERTGLRVGRVMVPPHGACSEQSLFTMAELAFEAACISRGSLRHHNPDAPWSAAIGMQRCDTVAGLPVFSRFSLLDDCENSILIAALLNQPIIPRAHHQDIAEGHRCLEDVASFVNSLGPVSWTSLDAIARSSYATKVEGDSLTVKMLTNRITLPVPARTAQIRIEQPPAAEGDARRNVVWRRFGGAAEWHPMAQNCIAADPGTTLDIWQPPPRPVRPQTLARRPYRLLPVARRLATETLDRTLPPLHRMLKYARRDARRHHRDAGTQSGP
jgi:hypothetical protein